MVDAARRQLATRPAPTSQERKPTMDVLLLLAIVCLLSGTLIAGIQKAWPLTLLSLGLTLAVLAQTGLIT
ncbi:hypothetical protein ABGB18_11015 [Nonomuraea sp. B12E4]|uniref:hypothetical protein n=1 Tax=Nonomuraea sp. B12E4 TaxID=3153564 RepID=UPI00325CBF64